MKRQRGETKKKGKEAGLQKSKEANDDRSKLVYINGVPHVGSLTPFMDKCKEINGMFIASEKDIRELENTRATPFDNFFLGVLEKHHGFFGDDDDDW